MPATAVVNTPVGFERKPSRDMPLKAPITASYNWLKGLWPIFPSSIQTAKTMAANKTISRMVAAFI